MKHFILIGLAVLIGLIVGVILVGKYAEKESIKEPRVVFVGGQWPLSVKVGEKFTVDYDLENIGKVPALDVNVEIVSEALILLKSLPIEKLDPGQKKFYSAVVQAKNVSPDDYFIKHIILYKDEKGEIFRQEIWPLSITISAGCRKGICADTPNEWYFKECIVETCSCVDCATFSECWNAWTGRECNKDEPCRDLYGTNYREAMYNTVYKIDPTKKTEAECIK